MPVGKGSLTRAAKATEGTKEQMTAPVKKASAQKTAPKTEAPKTEAPKTEAPKTEAPKKIVVAASVISGSDDIHEKKFEAISKITCDLPTYLL